MSPLVHILQHVPFEEPGSIDSWLQTRRCRRRLVRLWAGEPLPEEAGDLLVVLGGPMGVDDVAAYPWLLEERGFIATCIARGMPVLGICLGAQLIARACDATVGPHHGPEIGWFPVQALDEGLCLPETPVFHWHGDTFALPAGAELLAASDGCRHQAFRLGERVIGLQFHLEMTPRTVAGLLAHCPVPEPGPFVQTAARMRAEAPATHAACNRAMHALLDDLTGLG